MGWVVRLGGWVRFWFGLFEVGGLDVFDLLDVQLTSMYRVCVQCTVYSVQCIVSDVQCTPMYSVYVQ